MSYETQGVALKMYLDPSMKTFMFDYSTQAVACDRKLFWGRNQNLRKVVHGEATYFGKSIHKFAEHFWLGETFDQSIKAYFDIARAPESPLLDDPDEEGRTVQRGFDVCTYYFKRYMPLRSIVKPYVLNNKPLVEVPFAFPLGQDKEGWTYIYCGRIDRVELREDKYIWVVDTKTTTRFGKKYWDILRPNDQITGYAAAVREIVGKIPNYYAIDVIAMGEPRERVPKEIQALGDVAVEEYKKNLRYEQGPTSRSPEEITEWWDNALQEGERMRKLWTENPDNMLYWTKRTSQCGSYGGCDFRDLCKETVNFQPIIDTLYEVQPWSPFSEAEEEKEVAP